MHAPRRPFVRRHGTSTCVPISPLARRIAPLLGFALLGVTACGKGAASRGAAPPAGAAAGAASPAASSAPPSASAVSGPIEAVGRYGEDAYDMVKSRDWARARATVDSLTAAVAPLIAVPAAGAATSGAAASGAAASGAPATGTPSPADIHSSVQALDRAVVARDRTAGMREANHLTELGAQLASGYPSQVPTGVTLLDYYGRELEIWSEAGDLAKLRSTGAAIRRTWTALRPQVEARGGAAEASAFDALVTRADAATTAAAFAAVATPILDAVDGLEKVFTR